MDDDRHDPGTPEPEAARLARRLEHLFRHVQPLGRRYTLHEVVNGIREAGSETDTTLSAGRLSMLLTGKVANPTVGSLRALARFFGVPAAYFLDDDVADRTMAQLELLNAMKARDVHAVALRAATVAASSAHGLETVRRLVEEAERIARAHENAD